MASLKDSIALWLKNEKKEPLNANPLESISRVISGAKTISETFFEPDPSGKLRLRDVVREIPKQTEKNVAGVGKFVKDVAQGTLRESVASPLLTAVNKVRDIAGQERVQDFSPEDQKSKFVGRLQKVLLGEDAVESLETRVAKAPERTTQFAKDIGFRGQNIITPATAPIAVVGSVALDLFPGFGKADDAVKVMAKSLQNIDNADDAFKILKQANVPDNLATDYAKKFAETTDLNEITKGINSLDETLKTTKQIVEQPIQVKTAADFIVGDRKEYEKLLKDSISLEERIKTKALSEPYKSITERSSEALRGAEELRARLRSDTSFGMSAQRKIDGGSVIIDSPEWRQLLGKAETMIPREQVDNISQFMDTLSDEMFNDVAISILSKGGSQGKYDFSKNIVTLYKRNIMDNGGKFDRTTIHELWHSLSRYANAEDVEDVKLQWLEDVDSYSKKNKWIEPFIDRENYKILSTDISEDLYKYVTEAHPETKKFFQIEKFDREKKSNVYKLLFDEENYRLLNIDEWFAENLTDKHFEKISKYNNGAKSIIVFAKNILARMIESVKQLFGGDVAGKIYKNFIEGKRVNMIRTTSLRADDLYTMLGDLAKSDKLPDTGTADSKLIETIKQSPNTAEEVASVISQTYQKINNEDTLKKARDFIDSNYDDAYRSVMDKNLPATADTNAIAYELMRRAQNSGNFELAIDIAESTAERASKSGQTLQALSIWGRMTPEGILKYTARQVDKFNNSNNLVEGKKIKITKEFAEEVTKKMTEISNMPDGKEKAVETAKVLRDVTDLFPPSYARRISTFQTLAQLLNAKTVIRNVIGNAGLATLENVKDVFAAGLDSALSVATKKRTTALPSLSAQFKGGKSGWDKAIEEVVNDIDLGSVTQYDLPKTRTFKSGPLANLEKAMNISLKGPDGFFYQAAYDGELAKQIKIHGSGNITEQMKEIAHVEALKKTMQDDNAISKLFVNLKRGLNGGQEFGLGDIILKYPKTPANILKRGIEYSPAGFVSSIYEAARPLFGKEFNQRELVESFSRAFTGTAGLVGSGALMHRLGIITGKQADDKDITAVEKTVGLGQYKVNASALKRVAATLGSFDPEIIKEAGKLQEGDVLYSYDWFQPAAIGLSMGANIDQTSQQRAKTGDRALSALETLIEGVAAGTQTVVDQPLMQGISRTLGAKDAKEMYKAVIEGVPASFVPTLLNQINQFADNQARSVYDPSIVRQAMNAAKRKIPGLSQTLEPDVTVWGKNRGVYQGGTNNLFNVFFNPAFRTVYKPTPEAEMVLDIYGDSGETKQAPRVQEKSIKHNGKTIKLGPVTRMEMQRFIGTAARNEFNLLAENEAFMELPNEEKVRVLSGVLTDIGSAAKIAILELPSNRKPTGRTLYILNKYYGIEDEAEDVSADTTIEGVKDAMQKLSEKGVPGETSSIEGIRQFIDKLGQKAE